MVQRFYPAVLERGARGVFAVWFPDFPDCVAGAMTQDEAMARAQEALAVEADRYGEQDRPLPPATPFEKIKLPKGCDLVALFALGVEPRDPSERVNVYLPKSLIARVDRRAAELGMSRSSLFGLALSWALNAPAKLPPSQTAKRQAEKPAQRMGHKSSKKSERSKREE
jgi:predicted RNase H-like HicB family nuclease